MYYIPFLGAIALATGTIIQKTVLRKKKINIKLYQNAGFLAITLVMIPLIFLFWQVNSQALELKNILIFVLVIVFSIIANLFVDYSMKWEKVSNLEPAKILEPLFIIFLAIIFSFLISEELYEANLNVIIPALLSGAALILSHIKKHHLKFNKYFLAAIAGSFFFALELIISRLILNFYSPISFYFIRCASVFVLTLIIFKPDYKKINTKLRWKIFGLGIIWVIYRIAIYYGYLHLGVIFTTLMLMLGPLFIYLFAWKFLKEKLDWRNIIAAIVIVGSILYAILV